MLSQKPTINSNNLVSRIVGTSSTSATNPTASVEPTSKPKSSYSYGRENEQLLEMLGLTKKKKKSKTYDYGNQYDLGMEGDQARLSDDGYMDINQLLAMKGY